MLRIKFMVVLFVLALANPAQARVSMGSAIMGAAAAGAVGYAVGASTNQNKEVVKEVQVAPKTKNSIIMCESKDGLLCEYDSKRWTPAQWAKRGGYKYIHRVETHHTGNWPYNYRLSIEVSN